MSDSRPRVLVVEDEEACFRLLVQGLTRSGYEVVPTVAWQPAMKAIVENNLEFAVIDIVLRGEVDGLSIVETIRRHAKHKNLPIVVVSGHYPADHGIVDDLRQLYAVYLEKPFTIEQLRVAVQQAKELVAQAPDEVSDYQIQTLPVYELPAQTDLETATTLP